MAEYLHHVRRLFVVSMLVAVAVSPLTGGAQNLDLAKPAIDIVASVSTGVPFSNRDEIEEASGTPLGSRTYVLIGVADFLAPEELLDEFQRAEFTTVDSVNSTGSLVDGHRILVKGLFIENERINLTSVIGLTERCG